MLHKENSTANAATLEISRRDQQDQKLHLMRNISTLTWEIERAEMELWKEPPDPLLEKISELVTNDNSILSGTAANLIAALNLEMKADILTRKLNINSARLFNEYGIGYSNRHGHSIRVITLWIVALKKYF